MTTNNLFISDTPDFYSALLGLLFTSVIRPLSTSQMNDWIQKPTYCFFFSPLKHRNSYIISRLIFILRFDNCIGTLRFLVVVIIIIIVPVTAFSRCFIWPKNKRFLAHEDYFCFTFRKICCLFFSLKDSSGNNQMKTAIITTRKVVYLIFLHVIRYWFILCMYHVLI